MPLVPTPARRPHPQLLPTMSAIEQLLGSELVDAAGSKHATSLKRAGV
jgi:hypothetical protein